MTPANVLCAALFSLGLYGVLARRDLVAVLACVEIMLGAANLQHVVLGAAAGASAGAEALAVALIVIAAAEAAVGLGLVLATAKRTGRSRVEELTEVSG